MSHLTITHFFERVLISSRERGPTTQHSPTRTFGFIGVMGFYVDRDETVEVSP